MDTKNHNYIELLIQPDSQETFAKWLNKGAAYKNPLLYLVLSHDASAGKQRERAQMFAWMMTLPLLPDLVCLCIDYVSFLEVEEIQFLR